jgi:hypothetical protein
MPTQDSTPSFERDIRPLFRELDRTAMRFAFDLWKYEDVRAHAELIVERIEDGTMPCDTEWPEEQIELVRRWVEGGMPA